MGNFFLFEDNGDIYYFYIPYSFHILYNRIKHLEDENDIITAGSQQWMSHKDRQELVKNRIYRNEKSI